MMDLLLVYDTFTFSPSHPAAEEVEWQMPSLIWEQGRAESQCENSCNESELACPPPISPLKEPVASFPEPVNFRLT